MSEGPQYLTDVTAQPPDFRLERLPTVRAAQSTAPTGGASPVRHPHAHRMTRYLGGFRYQYIARLPAARMFSIGSLFMLPGLCMSCLAYTRQLISETLLWVAGHACGVPVRSQRCL
jgi:hypothetical protein